MDRIEAARGGGDVAAAPRRRTNAAPRRRAPSALRPKAAAAAALALGWGGPGASLAFAPSAPAFARTTAARGGGSRLFAAEEPASSAGSSSSSSSPSAAAAPEDEMNPADLDPHEYFADRNDFSVDEDDRNAWVSADETYDKYEMGDDWEVAMKKRMDGSVWSSFEAAEDDNDVEKENIKKEHESEDDGEAAWLDTLASIAAEEIEFNLQEADRADKVRQMQEWGFDSESISSTLGVATDESLEVVEDNVVFEQFKEVAADPESGFGLYVGDDVDMSEVESHTTVERDDETGDLVRTQMVYVDEHTCIGCTNCAMIAQSTFFMDGEHGRARVFQQWGDDDETIQVAIETCPVDCIHYVPYEELVRLEVERRDQNINFKARLVSQGEYGGASLSHRVGGPSAFTAPQRISGNMAARCNNCPTRGCKNCPMYGIGENPEFKRKEKERKERRAKKLLKEKMESENKSVDL